MAQPEANHLQLNGVNLYLGNMTHAEEVAKQVFEKLKMSFDCFSKKFMFNLLYKFFTQKCLIR